MRARLMRALKTFNMETLRNIFALVSAFLLGVIVAITAIAPTEYSSFLNTISIALSLCLMLVMIFNSEIGK